MNSDKRYYSAHQKVGFHRPVSRRLRFGVTVLALFSTFMVSSCGFDSFNSGSFRKGNTKEYFAASKVGVAASPRVAQSTSQLRKGGGRQMVGKPYKVSGNWYYPKEEPNYSKVGRASWYGDAFHGRLTANGEIYDMNAISAAHPTLPLPSYVKVTNLSNGRSLVVRVNDRGPFAKGRIIDLSKRAADLLGYRNHGTAKVKVEYEGPARMDGRDDWLLATYKVHGSPARPGAPVAAPKPPEEQLTSLGRTPPRYSAPKRQSYTGGFTLFGFGDFTFSTTNSNNQEVAQGKKPFAFVLGSPLLSEDDYSVSEINQSISQSIDQKLSNNEGSKSTVQPSPRPGTDATLVAARETGLLLSYSAISLPLKRP